MKFAVGCRLTSTKPSAVTLPTIFKPLAISVPRCLDANMVTSYASKNLSSTERLGERSDEAVHRFVPFRGFTAVLVQLRFCRMNFRAG